MDEAVPVDLVVIDAFGTPLGRAWLQLHPDEVAAYRDGWKQLHGDTDKPMEVMFMFPGCLNGAMKWRLRVEFPKAEVKET